MSNKSTGSLSRLLIVMAKYPKAGYVKTRLGRSIGDAAAARVYYAFLADLVPRFLPQPSRVEFDVCWVYTSDLDDFKMLITNLQATDLDEQIETPMRNCQQVYFVKHAQPGLAEQQKVQLRWAREQGYQQVVVISTDTPHLQRVTIDAAFTHLEQHDVVIGPTVDGGYYLLGIRQYVDILENVVMSTDHVADDIINNCHAANLNVKQLNQMLDIDHLDDLKCLIQLLTPFGGGPCVHTWNVLRELQLL